MGGVLASHSEKWFLSHQRLATVETLHFARGQLCCCPAVSGAGRIHSCSTLALDAGHVHALAANALRVSAQVAPAELSSTSPRPCMEHVLKE